MMSYGIYTRNQTGVTIYHVGSFETEQAAREHALKNFAWYATEPQKYIIVAMRRF